MKKFANGGKREGSFMKKGVAALLFATLAGSLTFGAAASLGLSANDLGQGATVVSSCDTDGVNIKWEGVQVNWVTLQDLDNRCDGQSATFTVKDAAGVPVSFTNTIPTDPSTDFRFSTLVGGNPLSSEAIVLAELTISGTATPTTP